MWLQGVGRRSQIGAVGRGAHEVVDADDVLVVKVQEELDLPQRRFAVVLFLNTLEIFLIAQACEGLHHRT